MAIVFKDHIKGKVLNAYNNNVIRFYSDSDNTVDYAKITVSTAIGSYSFELTASPEGIFYFNFKTVISKLINTDKFEDTCSYDMIGALDYDENAYLFTGISCYIYFTDETWDNSNFKCEFVKGVYQISEKAIFNSRGDSFPLLHTIDKTAVLTMFSGYPFDIPLFGKDIEILIRTYLHEPEFLAAYLPVAFSGNSLGYETITFNNETGVQRLALTDGVTLWEKIKGTYLTILFEGFLIKLRVLDKCGLYLKWHNQYGGWDYYLFEKHYSTDTEDKTIGEITTDFENLSDTETNVISMGKTISKSMKLYANGLYNDELERVIGIVGSPKVYMYTGEKGEEYNDDNWEEVRVNGKSVAYSSRNYRTTISIEIERQNQYTLAL